MYSYRCLHTCIYIYTYIYMYIYIYIYIHIRSAPPGPPDCSRLVIVSVSHSEFLKLHAIPYDIRHTTFDISLPLLLSLSLSLSLSVHIYIYIYVFFVY